MTVTPLSIRSVRLGAMPIVDNYIAMLGIDSLFERHVNSDPRDKIPVFDCLSIVLRNIVLNRHPLYKIGEWAIQRELVSSKLADSFNDDRIGRALDRLFAADRASLISEVVLNAIKVFNIDLSRIHNDSTTVTLFGDYDGYEDVASAKPRHGHNKDHRPDLAKQQDDCLRRTNRLELCQEGLTKLSAKPHKNRDKLESSVKLILQANNSKEYYDWQVIEDTEETFKQETRGRPDETV